jgi:pimeloyl-ACP methyl ester carboxylesterase
MLTLILFAATLQPSVLQAPSPRLVGEAVSLETPTGTLYGTIDVPSGYGPWPVVLLHPGSGPTDRDGNQASLRNNSLKMLGRALAAQGIAVLRVDKRGVAASRKALAKEEDIRLDTYAADVTAWVEFLRKDPRFTKIGFAGHSEGGLIGLVAAKDAKFDAYISLCGPGRPLAEILREQLKKAPRANLPQTLLDSSLSILSELEAGRTVKDVSPLLVSLFRPSVQPYLISAFRYDPATLVKGFTGPVLVINGTTDIQVPPADGERLTQAKPGSIHRVIPEMNHLFKRVPTTDRAIQLPVYGDPSVPLHPELVGEMVGFLKTAIGTK